MGKTFGEEIRELREAKGLSQGDLATMLGITQGALSHYEKGRRTGHDANLVNRLCEALGVSLDHFARFISPDVRVPPPPGPSATLPVRPHQLEYHGRIPCGRGEYRLDVTPKEHIEVPPQLWAPSRFVVRANGTSMMHAGILDGDYLIIHPQAEAEHGEIVLAVVDGTVTLKRLEIRKKGRRKEHWLFPASNHHEPILMREGDDNRILGVLKGRFGVV